MQVKTLVRVLFESRSLGHLRTLVVYRDALRQVSSLRASSSNKPDRALRMADLPTPEHKNDGVFYILGSGASVENLTLRNFAEIRQGISVGINAWVLHDFIPTIYVYEPVDNCETSHFETLHYMNSPEVLEAEPLILILRPRNDFEWRQLDQLSTQLRAKARIYGRVSPFTRRLDNLEADLKSMTRLLAWKRFDPIFIDSGASIVRMAHLGIKLGFKKIVFVGVDLNNTSYFWEKNPSYVSRHGLSSFESGQTGTVHETMSSDSRPFPVLEMVETLAKVARQEHSCDFSVVSPESELAKVIPVHQWRS